VPATETTPGTTSKSEAADGPTPLSKPSCLMGIVLPGRREPAHGLPSTQTPPHRWDPTNWCRPRSTAKTLSSVEDSLEGIEDQAQPELEVLGPSSLHDMSDDLRYVGVLPGGDLGQDGG
jgi:hypothetical protein